MNRPELIKDPSELDRLFSASHEKPVFLFKHSLTCPTSAAAHYEYLHFIEERGGGAASVHFGLVEVQRARAVSNEIADRTGVRHESPQAILLRDGAVAWSASHRAVTRSALGAALEES